MERKRYVELVEVAKKICDLAEKEGVTRDEGRTLRRITEAMWEETQSYKLSDFPLTAASSNTGIFGTGVYAWSGADTSDTDNKKKVAKKKKV